MRILLYSKFSTYSPGRVGGAETSIRLLGQALAERGHKVYYLTSGVHAHNDFVEREDKLVNVLLYPQFKSLKYAKIKKKILGKKVVERWFFRMLERVIKKFDVDLVYTYYDLEAMEAFLAIRDNVPFKLMVRMAGLKWYEESIHNLKIKLRYERIFRDADGVNYNTPSLKTLCIQKAKEIDFNLCLKSEFVGDIGASLSIPVPALKKKSQKDIVNIIVATRFSKYQKRQDILLEALSIMNSDFKYKVLMIGDGPARLGMDKRVADLGLEEQVTIVPFMEQEALWSELGKADLLCHPCDYEGLSKIIVESMLVGLPVLASRVVPLTDYISDNETGFLVENKPDAWAKKLQWIYENQEALYSCSDRAQIFASNYFSPMSNVQRYEKEFERMLLDEN